MTRTDGEHELVLGNKQLLSAFFLVVILLGVSFTMGYFVGRNTATSGFNAGQTSSGSAGQRPDPAGGQIDSRESAPVATPPPDSTSPAADPKAAAEPAESKPEPPAEPKPDTRPPAAEKSTPKTDPPAETLASPSSEQMYLQVFALRRPDADNQVKVLRNHGFTALLGESSKEGIYRVLVGPFKTNGEMGRAKAALKAKGFDSIVAK